MTPLALLCPPACRRGQKQGSGELLQAWQSKGEEAGGGHSEPVLGSPVLSVASWVLGPHGPNPRSGESQFYLVFAFSRSKNPGVPRCT